MTDHRKPPINRPGTLHIIRADTITPPAAPDVVEQFLDELSTQEVSPYTVRNYRSDLTLFARWFEDTQGSPFQPELVTPTDVREYRTFLIVLEKRSPATANRRLAALRSFFAWAQAQQFISENPTDSVKGVSRVRTAPQGLEKRDVDRLLRSVQRNGTIRDRAIVETLRHMGIRVGELVALRLGDVSISERKGELVIRSGKRGKYRVVPLNLDARRAISAYLAVRPKVPDDHLFIGQRRNGLGAHAVELLIQKYARLAGIPATTPHMLRHTFGKTLRDSGVDLVAIAELMGHERLDTTMQYGKPTLEDLRRASEKLEADYISGHELE